eukprot:2735302-Rhodomonas_salina.1
MGVCVLRRNRHKCCHCFASVWSLFCTGMLAAMHMFCTWRSVPSARVLQLFCTYSAYSARTRSLLCPCFVPVPSLSRPCFAPVLHIFCTFSANLLHTIRAGPRTLFSSDLKRVCDE